jgi:ABC-2 type transport system ATP-binding protein
MTSMHTPVSSTPALIELEGVSRSYGSVRALSDITLRLEPGTIGLVGNNGAGKSTLLKILLGLLHPDSGRGTILGCDIMKASWRLRGRVGYMSEAAATVPMLRGVDFVALSGDLYGMPHRDARRRSHEVLNYVGLGELRYRRLDEYSTGSLQRLKLAAALVHDPQLLLLDEPTNGLDPAGRESMLRLLESLIRETGKSVILCTHLLGDVERFCRQVVVLNRGYVVQAGPIEQLRAVVHDRYTLRWQGPTEKYLAALAEAGVKATNSSNENDAKPQDNELRATVPEGWNPGEFFRLAATAGVVLTHVRAEEENLESLFFRLTDDVVVREAV